jgi:hypothetical protein
MTALSHLSSVFQLPAVTHSAQASAAGDRLWLAPSGDGWSLITDDGVAIFCGLGVSSRRKCLERARDLGVLAVFG